MADTQVFVGRNGGRSRRYRSSVAAAVAVCLAALLAVSAPALASPPLAGSGAPAATRTGSGGGGTFSSTGAHRAPVGPGTNLIRNGGAETGDASGTGYDAVTIPGWRVVAGLPSVIRYGLARFVPAGTPHPDGSGHQLFIGGAGGPAALSQEIPLSGASGGGLPARTTYDLSAALGARAARPEGASLQLQFVDGHNRPLSTVTLGPVTAAMRHDRTELLHRQRRGTVPVGARRAIVTIRLHTAATDFNGPQGSTAGFNSSYADDVGLRLSRSTEAPVRLRPPVAHIPRYQHVVVVYLENQDYDDIVGNTREAPFTNQLISDGTLLSRAYAEEHPSDANYLALAAGSTLGLPLTDPAEEDSQYTLDARNLGDLVDGAHETWKAYLQSADGPCDDTVHNQYWDDDLPFMYFKDVRQRPAYCADHVVPQGQWRADLRHTGTTPSFSWLGANDCDDMEGCGIRAGDGWLRSVITPLLRSPAWRTQRTLLVLTWDEDAQDGQHPAQRIPTIVVGSRLVRKGHVDPVRATHYSLLRTIEGALGLGTLTQNDRYALPLNGVFTRGEGSTATVGAPIRSQTRRKGLSTPTSGPPRQDPTADGGRPGGIRLGRSTGGRPGVWVVDSMTGTVTPIDLHTGRAGPRITVGQYPDAAAADPDGRTIWVANRGSHSVTPIDAITGVTGRPVEVGLDPSALAFTPDGRTLLVADGGAGTVTPVVTASKRALRPIKVGGDPWQIVVSDGRDVAYVIDHTSHAVTPIDLRTGRALRSIGVGSYPVAETLSPDGRWLYVANFGSDTVTPIDTRTDRAGSPIRVGQAPMAVAFLPDGRRAYVVDGDSDAVTPITVAAGRAGRPIPVGSSPEAVVAAPGGRSVLVLNAVSGTVTPISTATDAAGRPIRVGVYGYPTAMALTPDGRDVEVLDTYAGSIVPIDLADDRPQPRIELGASTFPVAIVPEAAPLTATATPG